MLGRDQMGKSANGLKFIRRYCEVKFTGLRGPAAILFISRDTCSDTVAKLYGDCFCGGIAQLSRDMLQNGESHRCA